MPELAFAVSAYDRENGDLPELRLVNLFLEASPTNEKGAVLLSRAGLVEDSTPGSAGPVQGIFRKAGLFSGDKFNVIGAPGSYTLYRNETLIGTVPGSGPVSFATNGIDEMLINAGAGIRVYDGATIANVVFPDSASVTKIGFVNGFYIALRANTDQWYFSAVNDGTSWNALDFATAESSADNLLDLVIIGDVVWLFGEETTEPWAVTGDTDLPFTKMEQRSYQRGVIATGCALELGGRLLWVGDDARVYTDGLEPVADQGLAEKIRASASVGCFSFVYEGHPLFVIRLDESTWAIDMGFQARPVTELSSYLRTNWRVRTAFTSGYTVYLGDDELNTIWTFGGYTEVGKPIERLHTVWMPLSRPIKVVNIGIHANVGRAEVLSGLGSEPQVEMRFSRDEGKSWSAMRAKSLGRQGEYRKRPRWNRCGMFDPPGMMLEFRNTDTASYRVSGHPINEPGGGRARQ